MSYMKSVLQPNEQIVMIGRLHWIIYHRAFWFLIAGIILLLLEYKYLDQNAVIIVTAVLFGALTLVFAIHAWFIRWTTEIAVTNKRIIYKRGFITRHTAEMNMDKVASVDVDQSIFGRILDYGSIEILGTGGADGAGGGNRRLGIERLDRIASPLALRNAIDAR